MTPNPRAWAAVPVCPACQTEHVTAVTNGRTEIWQPCKCGNFVHALIDCKDGKTTYEAVENVLPE